MAQAFTKTLGVNAAFLIEIKEDHVELRGLLEQARISVHQPLHLAEARELHQLLLAIQDRLAMHFSLEEAYGYFEDALAIAPRLSTLATSLRAEHETLFVAFCEIVEVAEQIVYRECHPRLLSQLIEKFEQFDEQLAEHEQRETEMILDAYEQDVGVGD